RPPPWPSRLAKLERLTQRPPPELRDTGRSTARSSTRPPGTREKTSGRQPVALSGRFQPDRRRHRERLKPACSRLYTVTPRWSTARVESKRHRSPNPQGPATPSAMDP